MFHCHSLVFEGLLLPVNFSTLPCWGLTLSTSDPLEFAPPCFAEQCLITATLDCWHEEMFHRSQYRRFSYQQGCLRNCSVLVSTSRHILRIQNFDPSPKFFRGSAMEESILLPLGIRTSSWAKWDWKGCKIFNAPSCQNFGQSVGFFSWFDWFHSWKPHLNLSALTQKTAQNHRGWKGLDSGIFFVPLKSQRVNVCGLQKPGMLSGDYGFSQLLKKGQECGQLFFITHTDLWG